MRRGIIESAVMLVIIGIAFYTYGEHKARVALLQARVDSVTAASDSVKADNARRAEFVLELQGQLASVRADSAQIAQNLSAARRARIRAVARLDSAMADTDSMIQAAPAQLRTLFLALQNTVVAQQEEIRECTAANENCEERARLLQLSLDTTQTSLTELEEVHQVTLDLNRDLEKALHPGFFKGLFQDLPKILVSGTAGYALCAATK